MGGYTSYIVIIYINIYSYFSFLKPKIMEGQTQKKKGGMARFKVDPTEFKGIAKPQSSYFLFATENRPLIVKELTEKNVKIDLKTIGSACGDKWKSLSEDEKKVYTDKANALKEQYDKDFKEWEQTEDYKKYKLAVADGKKGKKALELKKEVKASNQPKKALSSYMVFAQEVRPALVEDLHAKGLKADVAVIGKTIAEKWKALSDTEKAPYNEKAEKSKAEHDVLMN